MTNIEKTLFSIYANKSLNLSTISPIGSHLHLLALGIHSIEEYEYLKKHSFNFNVIECLLNEKAVKLPDVIANYKSGESELEFPFLYAKLKFEIQGNKLVILNIESFYEHFYNEANSRENNLVKKKNHHNFLIKLDSFEDYFCRLIDKIVKILGSRYVFSEIELRHFNHHFIHKKASIVALEAFCKDLVKKLKCGVYRLNKPTFDKGYEYKASSFVYFFIITLIDKSILKIGVTMKHPEKRLKELIGPLRSYYKGDFIRINTELVIEGFNNNHETALHQLFDTERLETNKLPRNKNNKVINSEFFNADRKVMLILEAWQGIESSHDLRRAVNMQLWETFAYPMLFIKYRRK
jgi:hypothetical protein